MTKHPRDTSNTSCTPFFQQPVRGRDSRIAARGSTKLVQTVRSDATSLPAYVAVVEFGRPDIRVTKRLGEEATHEETLL
jgi:hypothetical protein